MSFSTNLKALRLAKGFSQEKLSEYLHTERTVICSWERGKTRPKERKIEQIAAYFKITVEELTMIMADQFCEALKACESQEAADKVNDHWEDRIMEIINADEFHVLLFADDSVSIAEDCTEYCHVKTYSGEDLPSEFIKTLKGNHG